LLLPAIARAREEARKLACKNNLRQVGITMETYVNNFGENRYYPYNADGGVATLSLLYEQGTRLLSEPRTFICPSTTDPTCQLASLDKTTCSYIGRDPAWGALSDSAAADTRVAGDDSLVDTGNNHSGGCNLLFLDAHVEFVTTSGDPTSPPLSATDA
jgi:prepilin-type processing-associated H-X9-DG protein